MHANTHNDSMYQPELPEHHQRVESGFNDNETDNNLPALNS